MLYKTIVLRLLEEQYQTLYRRHQESRTALEELERYALALKASHEHWKEQFARTRPQSSPSQIDSMAQETAIQELLELLRSESETDESTDDPLNLDAAMAFLLRPTPPA